MTSKEALDKLSCVIDRDICDQDDATSYINTIKEDLNILYTLKDILFKYYENEISYGIQMNRKPTAREVEQISKWLEQ